MSGQDNAILQQIMAASRPLAVTDIARFANRDDIANIQYSLKKLVRAGLIARPAAVPRATSYVVTPRPQVDREFFALRRQLFTDLSAQILGFDDQLEKSANLLNLIAGFYDHGTRVMTGAEQMKRAVQRTLRPASARRNRRHGRRHPPS
jgi:predicted MarR family transcription regulator